MSRSPLRGLTRKLAGHIRLLASDPERFGRNVLQVVNPALYERRVMDVLTTPPFHVIQTDDVQAGDALPRLNLLDTDWGEGGMTGGPNTALNLAARVAAAGVTVRLVATVGAASLPPAWFRAHLGALLGFEPPSIEIASAADPARPLPVGAGDLFMATHWRTAQQLKSVLPQMRVGRFFYLFQEFEAGFYPWSSNHALALETLGMDYWPVVNEAFLADYLFSLPYGRLAAPETRERALVFEPAVDRTLFHDRRQAAVRPRRLIFYARPTNTRNLFGLGLTALRQAVEALRFEGWEFVAIGSQASVANLALGHGHVLRPAPWVDYAAYADLLRGADVLLCPMLSPHTSYPVLEMVACGGLVVTNSFLSKSQEALSALSPDIIAEPATLEGFAAGLREAKARVEQGAPRSGLHGLPATWAEALDPVASRIAELVRAA